jgi:hypothetical protein
MEEKYKDKREREKKTRKLKFFLIKKSLSKRKRKTFSS